MYTGMHHISLSVSDIEQSIAFYKELGFELESIRYDVRNDYFRKIIAYPEGVVHLVILYGPYSVRLELIQYVTPKGKTFDLATPDIGSTHICFIVDDIHTEAERLSRLGVQFKSDVIYCDEGPSKGAYAVFLLDPDGYMMELYQPAPGGKL